MSIFLRCLLSLYTYSASDRDMGNSKDHKEFFKHFGHLIPELLRVTMPGASGVCSRPTDRAKHWCAMGSLDCTTFGLMS